MSKSLNEVLEFDKVLSYLSGYALSGLGRERCLNCAVFDDVNTIHVNGKVDPVDDK